MSNVGKNLEPVKFGIGSDVTSNTSPDQFGQVNSAQVDSTSGNSLSPQQSNLDHSASDSDASPKSQHHTLGTGRSQASPGNHIHDGVTSPKLGPLAINTSGNDTKPALVLTGAKGGNVALTNLIAMLKNFVNFTDNTT
jgi:hypothetical protein